MGLNCISPRRFFTSLGGPVRHAAPLHFDAGRLVLSFAGLRDEWHDIETGEAVKSCTIIVTAANAMTRQIHDRMPVVLDPERLGPWLAGIGGTELLKPAPEDVLQMRPGSRKVNRVGNDSDPTLIEAMQ